MNNYRIEFLDISSFSKDEILILISKINKSFPKNDLQLEYDFPNLKFYIIQLDMIKYKTILDSLSITQKLREAVFTAIDKIGSYGIKDKKPLNRDKLLLLFSELYGRYGIFGYFLFDESQYTHIFLNSLFLNLKYLLF